MTDRLIAFTVTLQNPIREDDAEHIKAAIGMIKGVSKVVPVVSDINTHYAFERAYRKIYRRVFKALEPRLSEALEDKDDE
jgi:hypothetical protein